MGPGIRDVEKEGEKEASRKLALGERLVVGELMY